MTSKEPRKVHLCLKDLRNSDPTEHSLALAVSSNNRRPLVLASPRPQRPTTYETPTGIKDALNDGSSPLKSPHKTKKSREVVLFPPGPTIAF